MFARTLILALAIASLFAFQPQRTEAEPEQIKEPTPKELISLYALKYGAVETQLLKVAKCESGFNPNAFHKNDGGNGKHSVGIFQFQESTFLTWEKKLGEDLDYYSYHDQIKLASFMFSKGQQKQWTCYRIYYT